MWRKVCFYIKPCMILLLLVFLDVYQEAGNNKIYSKFSYGIADFCGCVIHPLVGLVITAVTRIFSLHSHPYFIQRGALPELGFALLEFSIVPQE
jgi:uncharacterized membrane protein